MSNDDYPVDSPRVYFDILIGGRESVEAIESLHINYSNTAQEELFLSYALMLLPKQLTISGHSARLLIYYVFGMAMSSE